MTQLELRRKAAPLWLRIPFTIVVYVLFWPIAKFLQVIGKWPEAMRRLARPGMDQFGSYRPTSSDVIVAAGSKSGTNWTMQICVQIAHRGFAEYDHIHDIVPWPDVPHRMKYAVPPEDTTAAGRSPTGLRVIKTHLPLGNVPYVPTAKYICVVRDPKDVTVSGYFFLRKIMFGPIMSSLKDWALLTLSPGTPFGVWARHLNSFWRVRERDNILFLTFEQMKQSPEDTVTQIAEFMGVKLSDEERSLVIEKSSFSYMKGIGHKFDPIGMSPPWANSLGAMMRKGTAGNSREYLSFAQRKAIDHHWKKELELLGCDFPYDQWFGSAEPRLGD